MNNTDVTIGKGIASGKGLYAARDFKKGELVIKYELKPLTFQDLKALSSEDYAATHNVNGQIYLYPAPVRYVSHSEDPNVRNDHKQQADIALRDIKAGEAITIDARYDDIPVLKKIDAVLVKVPSIQEGLDFYREQLGMQTIWKKEDMAAVRLGESELVLSTMLDPETDFLVESVEHAVAVFEGAGGKIVVSPEDIPVGKVAVVEDPFGNKLTLVDLSKGMYQTDDSHSVILADDSAELHHELDAFLRGYEKAANSRDFSNVAPFIADDAVFWFTNGEFKGKPAIQQAFEDTYASIQDETYIISDVEWIAVDRQVGVCTYRFKSDGLVNGKRQIYEGKGTNTLKRTDGSWQIVHEHLSKENT